MLTAWNATTGFSKRVRKAPMIIYPWSKDPPGSHSGFIARNCQTWRASHWPIKPRTNTKRASPIRSRAGVAYVPGFDPAIDQDSRHSGITQSRGAKALNFSRYCLHFSILPRDDGAVHKTCLSRWGGLHHHQSQRRPRGFVTSSWECTVRISGPRMFLEESHTRTAG